VTEKKGRLAGKVAIVTGAGRGIGRATALALAQEGANVVLAARSVSEIEAVADEIRRAGRESLPVPTDVSNKSEVESMVKQALDRFGKVDILVNNAGVAGLNPIPLIREEDWDLNIAVNLKAVFLCTQAVFGHMCEQGHGHIVNVSSLAGKHPGARYGAYATAKSGVTGFTGVTNAEGRPYGVKATLVQPGPVDTRMRRDNHEDELSKLAQPEDVADLILLAVKQSPQVHTPTLDLYTTSNPEISMKAGTYRPDQRR
jgi:NAD(P)-dependent dehydrogenase (short-subunit alcohol dehydrogenase family)